MRFGGKTALVVGGNSGIGLACAERLASEGARVIIAGRDAATLASAAQSVGHAAVAVRVDIAASASIEALMAEAHRQFGTLDVLVISAGIGAFVPVRQITEADWDKVHGINLRGVFFTAQKALALMQRGGAIVLVGSIGAEMGITGNMMYATAKAGVRALGRNLAAELVGEGIRVNVVSPGPIETPIIRRNIGLPPEAEHELRKMMIEHVPMHRMGEPQEVAAAVAFLAASEASFITGVDLFVDGGSVSF
ncbi:MAG: SDR family oxidoreductase [Gammaproteobacteria bacterium]|nr:SDR family oxidoreductase [Gammaproteobacteria bacterium]